MGGCFGNHPFDRDMERQLMRHLEEESTFRCPDCGFECEIEDDRLYPDENSDEPVCPCKQKKQEG